MRQQIEYFFLTATFIVGMLINTITGQEATVAKNKPYGYTHQSFIDKALFKKLPARNIDSIERRQDSLRQI